MNPVLKKLALSSVFMGLFLHMPNMNNMVLNLENADPVIVAFLQIGMLALAAATLLGGEN